MPAAARKSAPAPDRPVTWTVLASLDTLYLHSLNTRSEPPDMEIAAMADSIAAQGLLQNLNGYDDPARPGEVGVVAGGRRLRAIQMMHAGGQWPADRPVPVQVTTDPDLAAAWAGTENEARKGLHPADEIRTYRDLARRGRTRADIARAWAVSEAHVARRLALADLPEPVLAALRDNRLSFEQAKAFTLARDADAALALLANVLTGSNPARWQYHDIQRALTPDTVAATDRRVAYVTLPAYAAAGGTATADLFTTGVFLHDANLLDRLFAQKAAAETEALRATEGWQWAKFAPHNAWEITRNLRPLIATMPDLPDGDRERLDALTQAANDDSLDDAELAELEALEARLTPFWTDADRARGGIVTVVRGDRLVIEGAYTRPGPGLRRGEPGDDGSDANDTVTRRDVAPKALPENLRGDLAAIRLLALQQAIRPDRTLLLDLLAFQLSRAAWAHDAPLGLTVNAPATTPEKPDGLIVPAGLTPPERHGRIDASAEDFAVFRALPDADRDRALCTALARLFRGQPGDLTDLVAALHPPQVRALWTPTAAGYLGRLPAPMLDALWAELVPSDHASRDVRDVAFGGLKKPQKAARLEVLFADLSVREGLGLSRDQNARIDAWLPPELCFAAPSRPGEDRDPDDAGDGGDDPDDDETPADAAAG